MAQHDYNIANGPGATVRADINALAGAIASQNSGASAPSVTFANMLWFDSTNSLLKIRNNANTQWITVAAISGTTFTLDAGAYAIPSSGSWFGTNARIPQIDTSGVVEIGSTLDFHPDAAGTEDYRLRIARATGANGATTITNTGSGGVNVAPGSGGLLLNSAPLDVLPVGLIAPYIFSTAPARWLLLYGQNVSRTTYAALFAIVGTAFGVGDGSTTFGLPDARGRVIAGIDNMGGSAANRLTGASGGVAGTLGAAGGSDTHALTIAELAAHTHAASGTTGTESADHTHQTVSAGFSHGANVFIEPGPPYAFYAANGDQLITSVGATSPAGTGRSAAHTHSFAITSGSNGSGTAHNVVQPTIVAAYIVYVGV